MTASQPHFRTATLELIAFLIAHKTYPTDTESHGPRKTFVLFADAKECHRLRALFETQGPNVNATDFYLALDRAREIVKTGIIPKEARV